MPSTCPICQEHFPQWMMYKMHLELHHLEPKTARPIVPGVKHPYTKEEKAVIVARGERRLGVHNFYGS